MLNLHDQFLPSFIHTNLPCLQPSLNHQSNRLRIHLPSSPRTTVASLSSPSSTKPVLSPNPPHEAALSSPVVHRYMWDTGPQYVMWYTSRPLNWENASKAPEGTLSGEVRLALSNNGLSWRRVEGPSERGAVLPPNSDAWWAFDTVHLSTGSVLLNSSERVRSDGGVYLLYYAGGDSEQVSISSDKKIPGVRTRIGIAISKDGEHFTRIEGEHPSGAILDVGPSSSFDDLLVSSPSVLHCPDNKSFPYVMYYHGASNRDRVFAIGRAESKDGFTYSRSTPDPVVSSENIPSCETWGDRGVCRPCVIQRKSGKWAMFVEVIGSDGLHRIGMCESTDGLSWSEIQIVLDVGEPGSFDESVSHPFAVLGEDEETVQLYYTGKKSNHDSDNGRGTCIGVAHSDKADWTRLVRVSGQG